MNSKKAFLKQKLIEFQRRIAELDHRLKESRESFRKREADLILELLTLLDAFENIDETIEAKQDQFDKSARMLSKNIRSVHKKLKRLLQTRDLVEIEFPEDMARIDHCKIVDTRSAPGSRNETILSVVKKGYVNKKNGRVLRKAEVITVFNDE
ncbi:nucleotide exchange factor GrpE [Desulfosarcina ovata]|uniref:Nucleotide exchange factor GrpE n=1 Tax=Desulfosarcina ovata subsp. ovata TaxID=2752305 RepID=A0A5K8AJ44_9BACT|nr:nucleotide exchange factor GrpE [Desulfosarcina ovata]BBO92715.1 hypothetical protein DSCOOX_58950 [Desulfosarcina ovata subsp. ovata]